MEMRKLLISILHVSFIAFLISIYLNQEFCISFVLLIIAAASLVSVALLRWTKPKKEKDKENKKRFNGFPESLMKRGYLGVIAYFLTMLIFGLLFFMVCEYFLTKMIIIDLGKGITVAVVLTIYAYYTHKKHK